MTSFSFALRSSLLYFVSGDFGRISGKSSDKNTTRTSQSHIDCQLRIGSLDRIGGNVIAGQYYIDLPVG